MKSGMELGLTTEINITVTPDMFAQFNGQVVHPAYSTVSMVYHMEWAARLIILPFLEDNEEGMGSAVTVKHLAPCSLGADLTIKAILTSYKNNVVLTKTEVTHQDKLIGVGKVKQVILPKSKIHQLLNK